MSVRFRIGAAAIGTLLAFGAATLPAHAADDAGNLAKAQKIVTDGIDKRLGSLQDMQSRLGAAKGVTDSDRATLTALLTDDTNGLTALKAKVGGETTVVAVRADGKSMIDDYRVYLLVGPKIHLTRALDAEADVAAKLQKVHDALAARLAKDPSVNTDGNKELLADMETQIQAAQSAISGQTQTLLAIKPGPDGKAITAAVKTVQEQAKGARGDLRKAVGDAKKVRDELKESKG